VTSRRVPLAVLIAGLAATALVAAPAAAFDADDTFRKGAVTLSVEAGGGVQDNFGPGFETGLTMVDVAGRVGLLPFGPWSSGASRAALEVGLGPYVQRYTDPVQAAFAGLGLTVRYHFLALGPVVPYVEIMGGAGGTDLRIPEIRSTFSFIVHGSAGASLFLTDRTALYVGYRLQHVSNGYTSSPNRGFESHGGILGVSVFFP
jgi:Lipid A 3-O-deacylase (PagL)